MTHSDVYDRLVKDNGDVIGQVAYAIYKKIKREFIAKQQAKLGTTIIPDDVLEEFYANQTDYVLKLYIDYAKNLTREFLDEMCGEDITKERQALAQEYMTQYKKLSDAVKPSFWYGVLQGMVASFLFLLSGYIILKISGSWDIILNKLLG